MNSNRKTTIAGIIGIITSLVFFIFAYEFTPIHLQYLTLLLSSILSILLLLARDPKTNKQIDKELL